MLVTDFCNVRKRFILFLQICKTEFSARCLKHLFKASINGLIQSFSSQLSSNSFMRNCLKATFMRNDLSTSRFLSCKQNTSFFDTKFCFKRFRRNVFGLTKWQATQWMLEKPKSTDIPVSEDKTCSINTGYKRRSHITPCRSLHVCDRTFYMRQYCRLRSAT